MDEDKDEDPNLRILDFVYFYDTFGENDPYWVDYFNDLMPIICKYLDLPGDIAFKDLYNIVSNDFRLAAVIAARDFKHKT